MISSVLLLPLLQLLPWIVRCSNDGKFFLNEVEGLSLTGPFHRESLGYWSLGDVDISRYAIKLGASLGSVGGSLWSNLTTNHNGTGWQVTLAFRIRGSASAVPSGLTLWYGPAPGPSQQERLQREGGDPLLPQDPLVGMALRLETGPDAFATASATPHYHPEAALVSAVLEEEESIAAAELNNGKRRPYMLTEPAGRCAKRLRNLRYPIVMRVTYLTGVLKVDFDNQDEGATYTECLQLNNVKLPVGQHLGLSCQSSTDIYEIYRMRVAEMVPIQTIPPHLDAIYKVEKKREEEEHQRKSVLQSPDEMILAGIDGLRRDTENVSKQLFFLMGAPGPHDKPMAEHIRHLDLEMHRLADRLDELSLSLRLLVQRLDVAAAAEGREKNLGFIIKSPLPALIVIVQVVLLAGYLCYRLLRASRTPKKYL